MFFVDYEIINRCEITKDMLELAMKGDPFSESNVRLVKKAANYPEVLAGSSLQTICRCKFCNSQDNDMIYTHPKEQWGWLCIPCYSKFMKVKNDKTDFDIEH